MHKLLQNPNSKVILQRVADDASSLVLYQRGESKVKAPRSAYSGPESIEFDFDHELVNTVAYRRVLPAHLSQKNRERMVPQLPPVAEEPRLEDPIAEERSVSPSTNPFLFTSQQALKSVQLEIPNQGDNICQSYPVDDAEDFKGNFEQRPEVNFNSPPLSEAKLEVPESSTITMKPK
jgi:hypothetical protein